MANLVGILLGISVFLAGAILLIIYNLVIGILPHLDTGQFSFDPTFICVIAIIVGILIAGISMFIPDD